MVSLITLGTLIASQLFSSTFAHSNHSEVSLPTVFRCHFAHDRLQNVTNTASIEWGPCDPAVITNPALTCAFFDIPLDYHDPSAGQGRLALAKINATGERRGTAFINPGMSHIRIPRSRRSPCVPGGPGGSGLATLNTMGSLFSSLSGGLFDIVSWDPRGVGTLTM